MKFQLGGSGPPRPSSWLRLYSKWGKQKKVFANFPRVFWRFPMKFHLYKNSAVFEPRTGQFSGTWGFETKAKDLTFEAKDFKMCSRGLHLWCFYRHQLFFSLHRHWSKAPSRAWYGMEEDFSIFHTGNFLPFHFHSIPKIFHSILKFSSIFHSMLKFASIFHSIFPCQRNFSLEAMQRIFCWVAPLKCCKQPLVKVRQQY